MIAYEIQLRSVIRDKIQSGTKNSQRQIQSETKFSLRQNSVTKNNFVGKKFCQK